MSTKHFRQSIIFENPSLPSIPAFDDQQAIHKTVLKIRVRVFPIKAINFASLWDPLCYIEGVWDTMFKFEIWSCWSPQPPRWLWPHRSKWRHLCSAALFWCRPNLIFFLWWIGLDMYKHFQIWNKEPKRKGHPISSKNAKYDWLPEDVTSLIVITRNNGG